MPVLGPFTGADLCQITSLYVSRFPLPGQILPAFSPDAARLSLELASTAYDLETDNWRKAGWRDISYQVDNTLLSGPAVNPGGGSFSGILSDYFESVAQSRLKNKNPISQLRGALRQRERSDTCKAIVMLHPISGGRYIVAIGFMGTGKRIYDWFSNFRLANEEGAHLGFLQLTKQFEENCARIHFPETARELGLKELTLSDVLAECRRPGSRFLLWMAGHSQGSAVMQLFAFRAIENGLFPRNLLGYGFASPRVLYDHPACDLGSYPLFHVVNADDVIPRVGASLHVGRCAVFYPDGNMRQACYRSGLNNPAFQPLRAYLQTIRDSASAFLAAIGFFQALVDRTDEETSPLFPGSFARLLPDKWVTSLSGRLDGFLIPMIRRAEKAYCSATGNSAVPQALLQPLIRRCAILMDQFGAKACFQALTPALWLPHKLRGPMDGMLSYQYIVNSRMDQLQQRVWMPADMVSEGLPARAPHHRSGSRFARFTAERRHQAVRRTHKEDL